MTDTSTVPSKFILPEKVYDVLKPITQIVIPGLAALYVALSAVWGWDGATQVTATAVALVTFLGLLLGLSSKNYKQLAPETDGDLIVNTEDPDAETLQLQLNQPVGALLGKQYVTLKVPDPH